MKFSRCWLCVVSIPVVRLFPPTEINFCVNFTKTSLFSFLFCFDLIYSSTFKHLTVCCFTCFLVVWGIYLLLFFILLRFPLWPAETFWFLQFTNPIFGLYPWTGVCRYKPLLKHCKARAKTALKKQLWKASFSRWQAQLFSIHNRRHLGFHFSCHATCIGHPRKGVTPFQITSQNTVGHAIGSLEKSELHLQHDAHLSDPVR